MVPIRARESFSWKFSDDFSLNVSTGAQSDDQVLIIQLGENWLDPRAILHEYSSMTGEEKYAYRKLLYHVTVDIRARCRGMAFEKNNCQERAYLCLELTEWVHNLANFSAEDFRGFQADIFWANHEKICAAYPEAGKFRRLFEEDSEKAKGVGTRGGGGWGPLMATGVMAGLV